MGNEDEVTEDEIYSSPIRSAVFNTRITGKTKCLFFTINLLNKPSLKLKRHFSINQTL